MPFSWDDDLCWEAPFGLDESPSQDVSQINSPNVRTAIAIGPILKRYQLKTTVYDETTFQGLVAHYETYKYTRSFLGTLPNGVSQEKLRYTTFSYTAASRNTWNFQISVEIYNGV